MVCFASSSAPNRKINFILIHTGNFVAVSISKVLHNYGSPFHMDTSENGHTWTKVRLRREKSLDTEKGSELTRDLEERGKRCIWIENTSENMTFEV